MNPAPARAAALRIAGPAGDLEALLEEPEPEPEPAVPPAFAIVCHPHPQHGGSMHNKVVHTLARALQAQGLPALRFNYRGVGQSAGSYDEGRGECDDALAVIAWGRARWPGVPLVLAGFSFGAGIALRAAPLAQPARLITVAPAVHLPTFKAIAQPSCPWLIIQGEADELVDFRQVEAWAAQFNPPPQLCLLPGVGHFFHGALHELRAAVMQF